MLIVENESQDIRPRAKDAFIGLEVGDVNKVLETAYHEHDCPQLRPILNED